MPQIPKFLKGGNGPHDEPRAPTPPALPKRDIEEVISDAIQHTLREAAKVIIASAEQLLDEAEEARQQAQKLADDLAEMGDLQSKRLSELTSRVTALKIAIKNSAATTADYLPPRREVDVTAGLEAALEIKKFRPDGIMDPPPRNYEVEDDPEPRR